RSAGGSPTGFRNLFGPIERPEDAFRGYGLDEGNFERTATLLTKLAASMEAPRGRLTENLNIPSGYTYLAQLVAHDLSFVGSPSPSAEARPFDQMNFRSPALDLDTIYGGGPLERPISYCPAAMRGRPRQFLRLGVVREN